MTAGCSMKLGTAYLESSFDQLGGEVPSPLSSGGLNVILSSAQNPARSDWHRIVGAFLSCRRLIPEKELPFKSTC